MTGSSGAASGKTSGGRDRTLHFQGQVDGHFQGKRAPLFQQIIACRLAQSFHGGREVHSPPVLVLDELTAGVDVELRGISGRMFAALIRRERRSC